MFFQLGMAFSAPHTHTADPVSRIGGGDDSAGSMIAAPARPLQGAHAGGSYCLVRLMTATVVVTSDDTATITCATRRKVSM